jgi:phosphopantothenoylcysteine decarboxylase/phosphopantothenate--cysteine ligase
VCERVLAHRHFSPEVAGAVGTQAQAATAAQPLAGRRVVVSAGGTREPLDPVRFLGNRSSGKQGYALAAVAAARGAEVLLVSANADLPVPPGVTVVPGNTALEMREGVLSAGKAADVVVMAAAVADFRPADYAPSKIKKSHDPGEPDAAPTIELVRNPDILAELVATRGDEASPVIVGFAAETGDDEGTVLEHGRAKLARKGCDLLVVNEVGERRTFGEDHNTVHILRQGSSHVVDAGPASKEQIAAVVWDAVQQIL